MEKIITGIRTNIQGTRIAHMKAQMVTNHHMGFLHGIITTNGICNRTSFKAKLKDLEEKRMIIKE